MTFCSVVFLEPVLSLGLVQATDAMFSCMDAWVDHCLRADEHHVLLLQLCSEAGNSEDNGSGAVLRCLVAANSTVSSSCLREVQRAVASGLLLYQPVSTLPLLCIQAPGMLCGVNKTERKHGMGVVKRC